MRKSSVLEGLASGWRGVFSGAIVEIALTLPVDSSASTGQYGEPPMRSRYAWFTSPLIVALAVAGQSMWVFWLPAPISSRAQAQEAAPKPKTTLLGRLSEWKYPGSKMLDGASMSDGGNPLVVDVRCQAVLTTSDPFEKVVKFYSEQVEMPPVAGGLSTRADQKHVHAKAVSRQDDSEGRPVALRIIVVNKANTTITLVISRAKGENHTHIAWSHYQWFAE